MNEIATVFIVEDNENLLKLYKMMLNSSGFKIIGTAFNGKEAVHMFKSFTEKPDIILMDHRMPIKNGFEATKKILQIDANSNIIFVSADRTIKDKVLSIGAKNFVEKPFKPDILIHCIEKVLKLKNKSKIMTSV